jgi:preprotein translocase subunit SecA
MNAQREVVYTNVVAMPCLERLKLDIANMLYDTCELIVQNTKQNDFKSFEFDLIRYFSITSPKESDFAKRHRNGVDGE